MAFGNITNQIKSALRDEISNKISDALGNLGIRKKNSIAEFQASLNRSGGMARSNRYAVEITAHRDHPGGSTNNTINLHCSTITMPGHNLEQQTQKLGSEPATEIVQGHEYAGNITSTFYLDASLNTKSWFDKWQEMSFDPVTHKAKYYEDYIGTMEIYQLDNEGEKIYGIRCEEVYPATIGAIEYAYESTDTIAILSVEFAYKKWSEIEDLSSGSIFRKLGQEFFGETGASAKTGVSALDMINQSRPFDTSRRFK